MVSSLHYQASLILRDTYRRLSDYGWTQGVTHDAINGRSDLLGAVAISSGIPISAIPADAGEEILLSAPLVLRLPALHAWEAIDALLDGTPMEWNDKRGRKPLEVLNLLDGLAASMGAGV